MGYINILQEDITYIKISQLLQKPMSLPQSQTQGSTNILELMFSVSHTDIR